MIGLTTHQCLLSAVWSHHTGEVTKVCSANLPDVKQGV